MALLTATTVGVAGATNAPAAVSASDTISVDSPVMWLIVENAGGSTDTVTIVDSGRTPAGNTAVSQTVAVPATTGKRSIRIPASAADPTTGLVTVQHSFTTSVTQQLFRAQL